MVMVSRLRPLLASLLILVLALVSGCGSSPAPAAGGAQGETPAQNGEPAAPATRKVKHFLGETEVPAQPQRVVVLDTGELDIALSLGVKPVGAVIAGAESEFPAYLRDRTDGIAKVGTVTQPNLEAIAALQPDLILTNAVRHKDIYGQLSQIAPTVVAESLGYHWKDSLRLFAEALGKTAEYEQLMSEYHGRLDQFKQAMGDRLSQTRVSTVRSFPDHVRIYMRQSFMGTIIDDAGLPRPAAQDKMQFMEKGTEERIPDMDGDVIFVMYYGREQGDNLSQLTKSPLWAQLEAVKNGKVYEVDDGHWGLGLGPIAANKVIDDLFKFLVEQQ